MSNRYPRSLMAATSAAFLLSSIWYICFGSIRAELLDRTNAASAHPAPAQVAFEILRTLIVAVALGAALRRFDATTRRQALQLALQLFIAFPAVLLLGSVVWDHVPLALAAIHGGDWLIKLIVVALAMRHAYAAAPSRNIRRRQHPSTDPVTV